MRNAVKSTEVNKIGTGLGLWTGSSLKRKGDRDVKNIRSARLRQEPK